MAFSIWLCTNSTKTMFVKIVHPGGHAELHDRPVLAAEIMLRNPRCIVAHTHVFQQPSAIVAPDTMLMLGQKFYVVPISTVQKLQRLSYKYSSSRSPNIHQESLQSNCKDKEEAEEEEEEEEEGETDKNVSTNYCWFFVNKNTKKISYSCPCIKLYSDDDHDHEGEKAKTGSKKSTSKDNCFMSLLTGMKIKANGHDDLADEARSSSTSDSSETKGFTRKRTEDVLRRSPKRSFTSIDHWQPGLESITEE